MTGHNATSFSDIQCYGRCPMQYYNRKALRIQRKQRSVALFQGSKTHNGLQEFFLAYRDGETFETAWAIMMDWFEAEITQADEHPMLFAEEQASAVEIIREAMYFASQYLIHKEEEIKTWTILHVEEEFITVLDNGDVVSFTPDLIIQDKNGFIWIVDHKTTSKMPQNGVPFADLQALLYYAGVRELYPNLRGFIFSYMRKKIPTEPRLNKTHNKESKVFGEYFVNNLKSIDTTYEILRDFLLKEAPALMGEPSHQQRLAELRDNDERFFWEDRLTPSDDQVAEVLGDVIGTLEFLEMSRTQNIWPRVILNDLAGVQACGKCEFNRICHTQMLGWNVEMVLADEYEPRDPKNEYESEEE